MEQKRHQLQKLSSRWQVTTSWPELGAFKPPQISLQKTCLLLQRGAPPAAAAQVCPFALAATFPVVARISPRCNKAPDSCCHAAGMMSPAAASDVSLGATRAMSWLQQDNSKCVLLHQGSLPAAAGSVSPDAAKTSFSCYDNTHSSQPHEISHL